MKVIPYNSSQRIRAKRRKQILESLHLQQSQIGNEIVTRKQLCGNNIKEYMVQTTMHGFRYIGDNTITLMER